MNIEANELKRYGFTRGNANCWCACGCNREFRGARGSFKAEPCAREQAKRVNRECRSYFELLPGQGFEELEAAE